MVKLFRYRISICNIKQRMGEAASAANSNAQFSQLQVTVQSAKITGTGGVFSSKPDPFVELSVDGQPPRKTEAGKKTTTPKWDEDFTILVTPYSKIDIKIMSQNTIRAPSLLGQTVVELHVKKLTKTVEVSLENKGKTGEVTFTMDGMEVNMTRFPKKNTGRITQANGQVSNSRQSRAKQNPSSSRGPAPPVPPPPNKTPKPSTGSNSTGAAGSSLFLRKDFRIVTNHI
ncbi:hypothetical protein KUTeg_009244 [Tegillarca granosa]|uniref:C2 domain-containing protein n=1 Tax=Tegillarca granosa TaxID=220873 RepID=A0ABQ9F774_TEGGR|nr:hypothetical protein KUTeg_009244 [Tegillarca granosa]